MSGGFDWAAFGTGALASAGASYAAMLATFAVGVARGRHRYVDITWGLAFTAVAWTSYGLSASHGDDGRRLLAAALTTVWGVRLAAHIARRGRGHDEDPRYERMLSRAPGSRALYALRKVYLLQGALAWVISLPVQAACYLDVPLGPLAYAGAVLWAAGTACEAVGDHQLARFKADPANKGKIMDRGLWSWTRHPNYFGEFLLWWGLFLLACARWETALLTVVSPLLVSFLVTRGSGKRLLEAHMADRPGFAEYQRRTSGFVPWPPRARATRGG
ncbi:DUF1295 domain-containing protein [Streptomyces sp. NPDC001941]|uniref:DUF1295 domain-containing protein n=1 Tax=Streptomyces sp. NPDC001941 TaxID=3154659 RepID=UPI00331A8648